MRLVRQWVQKHASCSALCGMFFIARAFGDALNADLIFPNTKHLFWFRYGNMSLSISRKISDGLLDCIQRACVDTFRHNSLPHRPQRTSKNYIWFLIRNPIEVISSIQVSYSNEAILKKTGTETWLSSGGQART